jgi:hypothetical protein
MHSKLTFSNDPNQSINPPTTLMNLFTMDSAQAKSRTKRRRRLIMIGKKEQRQSIFPPERSSHKSTSDSPIGQTHSQNDTGLFLVIGGRCRTIGRVH